MTQGRVKANSPAIRASFGQTCLDLQYYTVAIPFPPVAPANHRRVVCLTGLGFAYNLGQTFGMSSNAKRLGEYVLARRDELQVSQLEVWQAGGPSNTTLTKIESGHLTKLERATARKLDAGLGWEPGSARRVWEGGEPSSIATTNKPRSREWLRGCIDEAEIPAGLRARLLAVLDEREGVRGA